MRWTYNRTAVSAVKLVCMTNFLAFRITGGHLIPTPCPRGHAPDWNLGVKQYFSIIRVRIDAPLNYDVPTLSKCNHSLGSLKVLIGKNNWRKYQGTIEKNILLLSDPELKGPEQTVCRIELKPNIKFTLLPRRSNDYRFKMTNGSAEYCFKTSNVRQRDSWIKVLTEATSSICQMACPRCCKMASESRPSFNESSTSQSDASDVVDGERIEDGNDDVFYVGMASPKEGIAFVNPLGEESRNVLYSAFGKLFT